MDSTLNVDDNVEEPKVGMVFDTIDEVKEYYRRYGNQIGFSILNRTSGRNDDSQIVYVSFACSREGKAAHSIKMRQSLSRKTECKAKLNIALRPDGKWRLSSFKQDHNHALSREDSHLLKWGKNIIVKKNSVISLSDSATAPPSCPTICCGHPKSSITSEYAEMDSQLNVEDKVEEPKEGMMFDTIDEVREYYRRYGYQMGFSIMNRTSTRDDNSQIAYFTFACSLEGKAGPSGNMRRRPSRKTECKAKLSIALRPDGKWRVSSFNLDHNHALTPGDSRLLKCGRNKFLEKNSEMSHNVTRLQLGKGDIRRIQNYFLKMQGNNSHFFYVMDLNDEGYLRNVFWADARSRASYEEFGDVITFDTSYLTRKYDLPFAPFLGINHHGQSTLLGCALLSSENTETFNWLFHCFLACMSDCAPKTIITDQGKAMQNAVEIVFPSTRHRWCLFQMMKKLRKKLRGYNGFGSVYSEIQNIVYDSVTCHEFEECWNIMIGKHKLQSNKWFLGLFDERRWWVPTFLKDTFDAGMFTGQRSESVVVLFAGYVSSNTTLKQFVEQYEIALWEKMQNEEHEDYSSCHSVTPCITHYAMEKQFQDAYTSTIFKEFQHELRAKIYCEMASVKKDVCSEYQISENLEVGETDKFKTFRVSLKHDVCDIHCSCCLFESKGILCRHAIVVLIHNKIFKVPEKYIIRRWRKDLRRRHTKVKFSFDECNGRPEVRHFDKMCNIFSEIADLSIDFEDKTKRVMNWINKMENELKREEGIWSSSQFAITMNDGETTADDHVIPIAPPFKGKRSEGDHVAENVKKRGRNR